MTHENEMKLKPCPFCGGVTDGVHSWPSGMMVVCADRKCRGGIAPYHLGQSEQQAITAWNTRINDNNLIEALEKILDLTDLEENNCG